MAEITHRLNTELSETNVNNHFSRENTEQEKLQVRL